LGGLGINATIAGLFFVVRLLVDPEAPATVVALVEVSPPSRLSSAARRLPKRTRNGHHAPLVRAWNP
jgi:hypothetical protein